MKITVSRLKSINACSNQVREFIRLWPSGCYPTVENMMVAAAHGLDVFWLLELLPKEGPGSRRAFALWCSEQVEHMMADERSRACMDMLRRRVADPESVSEEERAATWDAAMAAAWAAARAADWNADWAAAWAAQITCLSQLLMDH